MVQKEIKLRGRPRHFDEGDALDKAMRVFWAKGYDGATVDDLVAGTGVGRPSLYATFGDKQTLFLRCLENYSQHVGMLAVEALHADPGIREAIGGFLRQAATSATSPDSPSGCLLICVVPSVDDAKVREISANATVQAMSIIERRLEAAVNEGELPTDFPCAVRARQVLGIAQSLVLRARFGASRAALLTDADEGVALLLGAAEGR